MKTEVALMPSFLFSECLTSAAPEVDDGGRVICFEGLRVGVGA